MGFAFGTFAGLYKKLMPNNCLSLNIHIHIVNILIFSDSCIHEIHVYNYQIIECFTVVPTTKSYFCIDF